MLDFLKRFQNLPDWTHLDVEPTGTRELDFPAGSDVPAQLTWGYVFFGKRILASYGVEWCPGRPDLRAHFNIILGNWREGSTPDQRQLISMEYNHKGEFMVVDATDRLDAPTVVTNKLLRSQVIGKSIARKAFLIADAVIMKEPNLNEVRRWRS